MMIDKLDLAPIVLFVYNRPEHTKKMLEALALNKYANESILYVYADGPKENSSIENNYKINEVRKIVKEQKWPRQLVCKFAESNIGCRDNIIEGVTEVLDIHGKVIVLEDDIITSPAFLSYMNQALILYKDRKTVFSISGHSHSPNKFVVPKDYDYDVFASPRIFNWGWGTWLDRWEKTDWTMSYYQELLKHPYEIDAFQRMGSDMMIMLKDEYEGRSSAWDIQFTFSHFKNNALSIVPCVSYTHNIGLDGSGTHCNNIQVNSNYIINDKYEIKWLDNLYLDKRIINLLYSAFLRKGRPLWKKMINRLFRICGKKSPFVLKGKIYV